VTASLVVAETEAWIATLLKTGKAPLDEKATIPAASFVTPLAPGDLAPDTGLVDDSGGPMSLADWPGSAVAVTFIYVRCPLPEYCPLLDRRFAEVQHLIAGDAGLRGRARLLSVSFDPDVDTPARLRAHAEKLHADPSIWRFATAPREVVDRFAATFGVNVIREADATITHNMRTAVIGPDRRLISDYDGNMWTAEQIADDMRRALAR
jgi:protein SCO1/2